MADNTNDKPYLRYFYRADVTLDGVLLEADAFIGIHETFDYMNYMFPMRILVLNVRSSVIKATQFLDKNTSTIEIKMFEIEKNDEEVPKTDATYTYNESELYTVTYENCIVDQEIMPFSDEEVQDMNEKNADNEIRYMVRFHLGNEHQYPFTLDVFNAVLKEDTSPSSVAALAFLKCADPELKLYMDKPDPNVKVPAGTIFKPMGFLQTLDELQLLGMYPLGYNVFVEEGIVSILSKDGGISDDDTYEADFIIKVANNLSMNTISAGLRPGFGNTIVVPSTSVIINDAQSIYYQNNESKITSDGKIVHPKTTFKNVSYFVNNDKILPKGVKSVDTDTRMQTISIKIDKAYFDVDGSSVLQMEASHYTLSNLTVRLLKRMITPAGCVTNLVLQRRITD